MVIGLQLVILSRFCLLIKLVLLKIGLYIGLLLSRISRKVSLILAFLARSFIGLEGSMAILLRVLVLTKPYVIWIGIIFFRSYGDILAKDQVGSLTFLLELFWYNNVPVHRPFHFQAVWLTHPGLKQVVEKNWHKTIPLRESNSSMASILDQWNKDVFGNIHKKKQRLIARIDGV